jgi:hypothetical protein
MIRLISSRCTRRMPAVFAAEPYTLGLGAAEPACTIFSVRVTALLIQNTHETRGGSIGKRIGQLVQLCASKPGCKRSEAAVIGSQGAALNLRSRPSDP